MSSAVPWFWRWIPNAGYVAPRTGDTLLVSGVTNRQDALHRAGRGMHDLLLVAEPTNPVHPFAVAMFCKVSTSATSPRSSASGTATQSSGSSRETSNFEYMGRSRRGARRVESHYRLPMARRHMRTKGARHNSCYLREH